MAENRGKLFHSEIVKAVGPCDRPVRAGDSENGIRWVRFGSEDDYPNYLLDLYAACNKHSSIIRTKKDLAVGAGIKFLPAKYKFEKTANNTFQKTPVSLSDSEIATLTDQAEAFFYRIGIGPEFTNTTQERFLNWFLFGGGYITIAKASYVNANGVDVNTKISAVKNQLFQCMRIGISDPFTIGATAKFHYMCSDFPNASQAMAPVNFKNYKPDPKKCPVIQIPVYNPDSTSDWKYQSMLYGNIDICRATYPTADYESKGSLASIESDYALALFDRAESVNGLGLDYIVVINRQMLSDETAEKEKREKEKEYFRNHFKGADNAGSFMLQWYEPDPNNPNQKPIDIINVPRITDYSYVREKRVSLGKEILSAHGMVVSELAGIQGYDNGGFASEAAKIYAAAELFHQQRIRPIQEADASQVLNQLLADEGIPLVCQYIPKVNAIREISDVILQNFYLIDEVREKNGDKPLTEEQKTQLQQEVAARIAKPQNSVKP